MMNSMEKYEAFRNMSQELFDSCKYMYNIGHTGVFENIANVVKYAIIGLLSYISYTQFDANAIVSVLSGISAFCMAFRNRLVGIIPSVIGAVKMTKRITSSKKGADDVSNLLENMREDLEKDIVERVQPYK